MTIDKKAEKVNVSEPKKETDVSKQVAELTTIVTAMAVKDKEKDEKIQMLIDIADESRKERFASKKKIKIVPRVKLTTLNGKVVIGSRTLIDEVYKDLSDKGNWVEKQIHNYTFEDGSNIDMPLPMYTRIREKIDADVLRVVAIPEKEGRDGETYYRYTVKVLEDGREITLDAPYIN